MAQDVPEADAAEQAQEVVPANDDPRVTIDPEKPEADAIEQSQEVPLDDEDQRA